jgi:ankyrin repeat protein
LSDIGILLFQYGTTPLIWACRKGHLANVEALLDAGGYKTEKSVFFFRVISSIMAF